MGERKHGAAPVSGESAGAGEGNAWALRSARVRTERVRVGVALCLLLLCYGGGGCGWIDGAQPKPPTGLALDQSFLLFFGPSFCCLHCDFFVEFELSQGRLNFCRDPMVTLPSV